MSVVAKYFVQKLSVYAHAPEAKEVVLSAVSRGEENKSWAQYTPSGSITMSIRSGPAAEQFEIGMSQLAHVHSVLYSRSMTQTEHNLALGVSPWDESDLDRLAAAVGIEDQYRDQFGYFEPSYGMPVSENWATPHAPLLADNAVAMTDAEYVRFAETRLLPQLQSPSNPKGVTL